MITLNNISTTQKKLSENTRLQRLSLALTQRDLSDRSGVALPTLRKFEQKGLISLEGFLKLQMVLGGLDNLAKAIESNISRFSSIDEVLQANRKKQRQRGNRK